MRISVWDSRELQATILAIKGLPRELQAQIRKHTRAAILPEWQKSVAERADTMLEQRVLVQTARATVSNQTVTLTSGSVGKPLSGGLSPKLYAKAVEFGANPRVDTYSATSRKGKRYDVTRNTTAGLPRKRRTGPVHAAAKAMIPRFASLWVQTTIRTMHEAIERK